MAIGLVICILLIIWDKSFKWILKYKRIFFFESKTQKGSESEPNWDKSECNSYQPKRLGHFDPSTDVHTVTRPNTAGSQHIAQLSPKPSSPLPVQFPTLPFRPLKIHPQDLDTLNPDDAEARLQSWDAASVGGASVISVFDCHHGCFSPDHSMPHCEQHQGRQKFVPSDSRENSLPFVSDNNLAPVGEPSQCDKSKTELPINRSQDQQDLEQTQGKTSKTNSL